MSRTQPILRKIILGFFVLLILIIGLTAYPTPHSIIFQEGGILIRLSAENLTISIFCLVFISAFIFILISLINEIFNPSRSAISKSEIKNLIIELEQHRAVIENSQDPMFINDMDGRYVMANQVTCDYIGVPKQSLIGKTNFDVFPKETAQELKRQHHKTIAKRSTLKFRETVPTPNGNVIFETTRTPLFSHPANDGESDASNPVVALIGVCRNITDELKAAKVLEDAKNAAENASHAKSLENAKLFEAVILKSSIIEASVDGIAILEDGQYLYLNEAYGTLFGYAVDELLGKSWEQQYSPTEQEWFRSTVFPMLNQSGEWSGETVALRKDGSTFSEEIRMFLLEDSKLIRISRDISDRKQAEAFQQQLQRELEEALSAEKQLAQITLESIHDGVITTNPQGLVAYMNPRAEAMTGYTLAEAKDCPIHQLFVIVNDADGSSLSNPVAELLANQYGVKPNAHPVDVHQAGDDQTHMHKAHIHKVLVNHHGQRYAIESSAALIQGAGDEPVRGATLVIRDVGQSRALAKKLVWQANHDHLTSLLNRRAFEEKLEQALRTACEDSLTHVLCYLDLDRFKVVNDNCGHLAGDELLQQITQLLKEGIRSTDVLARLGGDEFGLLLYQCPLKQAEEIAERLCKMIRNFQFTWGNKYFQVGVTIGLVIFDENTPEVSVALSAADTACGLAKNKGRNRVEVYQPEDADVLNQRQEHGWSIKLHQALERDHFFLTRQPIIASAIPSFENTLILENQPPQFYEVLLRLTDESSGRIIVPGAFIPAAERYGLAPEIDQWVVRQTLKKIATEMQTFRDGQVYPIHSINLSGKTLTDPASLRVLEQILKETDVNPNRICFEVTETAVIANLSNARIFIQTMKQLGYKFALDDFGAGVSGFAYLQELPVDFIKIDGDFVKNVATDATAYTIVEAIHRISRVMGLKTIAECIETDAMFACLQRIGIDYCQGYKIGHPEVWK